MSTEQSKSPLQFFAELGDLIAQYAVQPGFAVAMVIVSWIVWPIGALIASLLIVRLYVRSKIPLEASPSVLNPPRSENWLIFGGLLLIGIGAYALVREYAQQLPWSVFLIAVGLLLVGFAYTRRGGGSANA